MAEIPRYPTDLVTETLRVNVMFPQTLIGTTVLVADKAFQGILSGAYTWEEVAYGDITAEHRAAAAAAYTKAHEAFHIPRRSMSDTRQHRRKMTDIIGDGRLCYAEQALWAVGEVYRSRTPDAEGKIALAGMRELCNTPSPEFVAIAGLWAGAAAKLRAPEGAAFGDRLRRSWSTLWNADVPTEKRQSALDWLGTVNGQLGRFVDTGMREQRDAVEMQLGTEIPAKVVDALTTRIVAPIRVPRALPSLTKIAEVS